MRSQPLCPFQCVPSRGSPRGFKRWSPPIVSTPRASLHGRHAWGPLKKRSLSVCPMLGTSVESIPGFSINTFLYRGAIQGVQWSSSSRGLSQGAIFRDPLQVASDGLLSRGSSTWSETGTHTEAPQGGPEQLVPLKRVISRDFSKGSVQFGPFK
jgi:hypothetical protein